MQISSSSDLLVGTDDGLEWLFSTFVCFGSGRNGLSEWFLSRIVPLELMLRGSVCKYIKWGVLRFLMQPLLMLFEYNAN